LRASLDILDIVKSLEPKIPQGVYALLWFADAKPALGIKITGGQGLRIWLY
jgi:hypothetical protein